MIGGTPPSRPRLDGVEEASGLDGLPSPARPAGADELSVEQLLTMADAIPETDEINYVLLQMFRTCCDMLKRQENRIKILESVCFGTK